MRTATTTTTSTTTTTTATTSTAATRTTTAKSVGVLFLRFVNLLLLLRLYVFKAAFGITEDTHIHEHKTLALFVSAVTLAAAVAA